VAPKHSSDVAEWISVLPGFRTPPEWVNRSISTLPIRVGDDLREIDLREIDLPRVSLSSQLRFFVA
jgi:hypothetical protein